MFFTAGWPANLEDLDLEAAVIVLSTHNCERPVAHFLPSEALTESKC
jgi:hypothetical protein